ncbi:hypothetical protein OHB26_38890 (plasmid) [Nocardia sp. NBC_01503]|uniref:hypothetical protein n=1 Tax=Nocardia sp. NBC_01503 TaxID=2975997 RepID=UPI002E7BD664|nr:hypothetical protein [Nocardia sp. NBC_01503]WTL36646.1 hypothetical protein OHB26_38890 [Nocardia sp. NBC_01503]
MAAARGEQLPPGAVPILRVATDTSAVEGQPADLEYAVGQELEPDAPERLAADLALIATLRRAEFSGPLWDTYACELARYAFGVLSAWMSTGHIFAIARSKRIPCTPSPGELERFMSDPDLRTDIADVAIVEALQSFRRKMLLGTGWRADGGASVTTYFIGACVIAFVNELNRHRRAQARNAKAAEAALRHQAGLPMQDWWAADEPSQRTVEQDVLRHYLGALSQRDRNIVWGKASGLTNKQITHLFQERSTRAVEQRWSALMKQENWIRRLGDRGSQ